MTSPMKNYKKDPMGMNRGAGEYYQRSYKGNKNWMSKYSEERDVKRETQKSPYQSDKYRHTGDNIKYVGKDGKLVNKGKKI